MSGFPRLAVPPAIAPMPSGDATGITDSASLQGAINALAAAGGGDLDWWPGTYYIATDIILKNDVLIRIPAGCIIRLGTSWVGSAMFTNLTTGGPLLRAGVVGLGQLNPVGTAAYVFDLHSPQFCRFGGDMQIGNAATTSTGIRIQCDVTTNGPWENNRNAMFNKFEHLSFNQLGTVIDLIGTGAGQVITLNEFADIEGRSTFAYGVRCQAWTDNNHFTGYHRYSLVANNAIGVQQNTGAPDVGVYANDWDFLAVDTFAGAFSGRIGVQLNTCRDIVIRKYHQQPVAEGGALVDVSAVSYDIQLVTGGNGTNAITRSRRGTFLNPGPPPRSIDTTLCQVAQGVGAANRGVWYRTDFGGTISKIAIEVIAQVGTENISVAVYRNNGLTGNAAAPTGNPVASSGAVAAPGLGYREISLGATIDVYEGDWLFWSADATTITLVCMSTGASGSNIGKGRQYFAATSHPAPSPVPALTAARLYGHALVGVP